MAPPIIVGVWSMAVTVWQQFEYYFNTLYIHVPSSPYTLETQLAPPSLIFCIHPSVTHGVYVRKEDLEDWVGSDDDRVISEIGADIEFEVREKTRLRFSLGRK